MPPPRRSASSWGSSTSTSPSVRPARRTRPRPSSLRARTSRSRVVRSRSMRNRTNNASVSHTAAVDIGAVDLNFVSSTADAGGSTSAYVAEGATLQAAALSADATSDNEAHDRSVPVRRLAGVAGQGRTARLHVRTPPPPTSARRQADPLGIAGTITLGAALDLNATSTNDATVGDISIGAGVVSVELTTPEMRAGGTTRVLVGGDYTVNASGITGDATATNSAGSDTVADRAQPGRRDRDRNPGAHDARDRSVREPRGRFRAERRRHRAGRGVAQRSDSRPLRIRCQPGWCGHVPAYHRDRRCDPRLRRGRRGDHGRQLSRSMPRRATPRAPNRPSSRSVPGVDISVVEPTIRNTHVVDAYVGPRAGVAGNGTSGSIDLAGALNITAGQVDAGNIVRFDAFSISVGLVTVDVMDPDVIESGQTLAHLGGNFSIDASQVNVTANAPDNEATSEVFGLNIGLGGGGDQALPVRAAHVTEAYVADGADFTITGGAAAFLANATGTARADQLDISISLLSIDAISSQATVEGRTRAFVGANARLQSGDASFTAQSTGNSAVADLNDVSVGFGGGASLEPGQPSRMRWRRSSPAVRTSLRATSPGRALWGRRGCGCRSHRCELRRDHERRSDGRSPRRYQGVRRRYCHGRGPDAQRGVDAHRRCRHGDGQHRSTRQRRCRGCDRACERHYRSVLRLAGTHHGERQRERECERDQPRNC